MDSKLLSFTCLLVFICCINLTESLDGSPPVKKPLPTMVIWHGAAGGPVEPPREIVVDSLEKYGAKVKLIRVGDVEHEADIVFHMRMDKQVMNVCRQLTDDPELKNGFALIGLSLGGTIARGLVQMCPELNITDFISLCAPQQGVFGLPDCEVIDEMAKETCKSFEEIQKSAVSLSPDLDTPTIFTSIMNKVNENNTIASIWVDPTDHCTAENYMNLINNRLPSIKFPKENFLKLERFIAVWCTKDTILTPRESPKFSYFKNGSETEVIPYNETDLYTHDYIGLKELDERGGFFVVDCPFEHMQYTTEWFDKAIIEQFYDV